MGRSGNFKKQMLSASKTRSRSFSQSSKEIFVLQEVVSDLVDSGVLPDNAANASSQLSEILNGSVEDGRINISEEMKNNLDSLLTNSLNDVLSDQPGRFDKGLAVLKMLKPELNTSDLAIASADFQTGNKKPISDIIYKHFAPNFLREASRYDGQDAEPIEYFSLKDHDRLIADLATRSSDYQLDKTFYDKPGFEHDNYKDSKLYLVDGKVVPEKFSYHLGHGLDGLEYHHQDSGGSLESRCRVDEKGRVSRSVFASVDFQNRSVSVETKSRGKKITVTVDVDGPGSRSKSKDIEISAKDLKNKSLEEVTEELVAQAVKKEEKWIKENSKKNKKLRKKDEDETDKNLYGPSDKHKLPPNKKAAWPSYLPIDKIKGGDVN